MGEIGKNGQRKEEKELRITTRNPCQSPTPRANTPARLLSLSTRLMQKSGILGQEDRRQKGKLMLREVWVEMRAGST